MSFEYPPETGFGGIGTYTWYQARALVKLGHEVHVLAGATEPTSLRSQDHDGVRVFRFRLGEAWLKWVRELGRHKLWWTKNRLENGFSMYAGLRELARSHVYDIVEMPECGAEGMLVNLLSGMNTVVRFHSPARLIMRFYNQRRTDVILCSLLEQLGILRATAFSACSQFLSQEVRRRLSVQRPVPVIPNGIDLKLFDAATQVDFRRKYSLPKDRLILFFSGRMEQRKGIHLCKEIVSRILARYDVAFVFAGQDIFQFMQGELLPFLKTRRLKGSIHYLGRIGMTEIRSGVCQSDIYLIPSLWENCPYSCLEAMAGGRAIVSSDQGGMPELIRDRQNGLLAKSGDPSSYIRCIEELIEDGSLRERLGAAARSSVEDFHSDVRVARMSVELYKKRLGR